MKSVGLLLTVAVVAVSFGSILIRLADAPALAIAAWRCGLAALIVGLIALPQLRQMPRLGTSEIRWLALSAVCLAGHFATWVASIQMTTVATSVVLVSTTPIWVMLLGPIITREPFLLRSVPPILLGLAGTVVVAVEGGALGGSWVGALLALAGAIFASAYLLIGRRFRDQLPAGAYLTLVYGGSALALLMVATIARVPLVGFSAETVGWLILLAVVPQLIGHTAFNLAVRQAPASLVALSQLGEPIGATVLALLLFREVPGIGAVAGGAVILVSILWGARLAERQDA